VAPSVSASPFTLRGAPPRSSGPAIARISSDTPNCASKSLSGGSAVPRTADTWQAVTPPELAHDVVERRASRGLEPQLQVERERHERALRVITDRRVRMMRLGTIEHVPRVEARVGEALAKTPRHAIDAREQLTEPLQKRIHGEDAAAQQQHLLVIARDAFEHPEQPRVVATVEPVRHQRGGPRALHVPRVKVLVARECEEPLVVAWLTELAGLRQIVSAEHQTRRRAVLEPAVTVRDGQPQEPIARERGGASEEIDLRSADLPQIRRYALEIRFETTRHDEVVRDARGLELDALEI